jgi:hypothetical protein
MIFFPAEKWVFTRTESEGDLGAGALNTYGLSEHMEVPGEQCTVVFLTEPATECVCNPTPHTRRFHNNLCKDDSALFSRFFHGDPLSPKPDGFTD